MPHVYPTWSSSVADKSPNITLSNGDLTATSTASSGYPAVRATLGKSAGKWYWEYGVSATGNPAVGVGFGTSAVSVTSGFIGDTAAGWALYNNNTGFYNNNAPVGAGVWNFNGANTIGIAVDLDNGKAWWALNNVYFGGGNPALGTGAVYSNLTGTLFPMMNGPTSGTAVTANFGASSFDYAAPSGFHAGWYTPGTAGVFVPSLLNGLGSGGSFFNNRIG